MSISKEKVRGIHFRPVMIIFGDCISMYSHLLPFLQFNPGYSCLLPFTPNYSLTPIYSHVLPLLQFTPVYLHLLLLLQFTPVFSHLLL
jgi:hypothetical protein